MSDDDMLTVRLSAGGKRGMLGKWHPLKPVIRFKPDNEYAVTRDAYKAQKHFLELVEADPAPAQPTKGISEAAPAAPDVPTPTEAPTEVENATEATEEAKDTTPAVEVKAAPGNRKYGKKE